MSDTTEQPATITIDLAKYIAERKTLLSTFEALLTDAFEYDPEEVRAITDQLIDSHIAGINIVRSLFGQYADKSIRVGALFDTLDKAAELVAKIKER